MSPVERDPVVPAPAPIVVFAYKRPDHLRTMIDSLRDNPLAGRSELRIYCDAPRSSQDEAGVAAVRLYASGIEGFAAVTPVFRDRNLGLARSIVSGVTDMGGVLYAYFSDPDGNSWALQQIPSGARP